MKKISRNWKIGGGIALVVLILFAIFSRSKGDNASAAETSKTDAITVGPENIAVVSNTTIMSGPSISGTLEPEREAVLRAQVSGSVLQTYADQGQAVSPGTVLARIDASGIQDAYTSARAGVVAARNAYDIATKDQARNEKLLAAGAIAERDIEQSRRAAIAAQAALEDANSRLASAERQYRSTTVTAPFAGVVSDRPVSAGDVVQPGTALYTVVDPSSMRLEASVPAEQLSLIRVGVPVAFTVSGYPGRQFVGHITRVNPTADPTTRQVRIYVSIPNAGRTLVGGLFASGRVSTATKNGLVVPASAVDVRGTQPVVTRVKGGKAEHVNVQIGLTDKSTETTEILAGLYAGDTLLLGAAQGITPGTPVKVTAPAITPTTASTTAGGGQ
ncbi:MAG TPA: efflux RND transporter periplasmic adaptor subunit [Gemmatimonadaceae bacterium]|jgi:membrane fusion protein, multidrug efflux system|nr:efflux RND transporter periplasmic adaptor subunit [Gemmatimonadaceae bacterium]